MRKLVYKLSDGTVVNTMVEAKASGLKYKEVVENIEEKFDEETLTPAQYIRRRRVFDEKGDLTMINKLKEYFDNQISEYEELLCTKPNWFNPKVAYQRAIDRGLGTVNFLSTLDFYTDPEIITQIDLLFFDFKEALIKLYKEYITNEDPS